MEIAKSIGVEQQYAENEKMMNFAVLRMLHSTAVRFSCGAANFVSNKFRFNFEIEDFSNKIDQQELDLILEEISRDIPGDILEKISSPYIKLMFLWFAAGSQCVKRKGPPLKPIKKNNVSNKTV